MYSKIDIQGLEQIVEANKGVPESNFSMRHWVIEHPCRTVACLIGNFCLAFPGDNLKIRYGSPSFSHHYLAGDITSIKQRFLISWRIANFLFASGSAMHLSKQNAISRLQKTIDYFKRKQKLWDEYEWEMSLSKKDRRLRENLVQYAPPEMRLDLSDYIEREKTACPTH